MSLWRLMLGFDGRIERKPFAIGLVVAVSLFVVAINVSLYLLPWMAGILAPYGINAGFALNAIWLASGGLVVWSLIALGVKRLRDRGRSVWWVVVTVAPLAALALANDAIFLVSRHFVLPRALQLGVLGASLLIGAWVLAECLIGRSRIILDEPAADRRATSLRERLADTGNKARPAGAAKAGPKPPVGG
jgi:uncharacterized membrane protein YhaH (DUF805 family)